MSDEGSTKEQAKETPEQAPRRPLFRGLLEDFRGLLQAPSSLWIIYAVKFIESISYFGVVAVLILYLHDDLRFSDEEAGLIYGTWGTFISLSTFLAGFVADAMGQRRALLFAALTLVVGRACLVVSEIPMVPLAGLALGVWGVASMKPVMTAAIKRHAPTHLRAFAYNIFYVVMNLGAFAAGQLVSFLRRGLLGRVLRPSELLSTPAMATDEARRALVQELLPNLPAPEGAQSAEEGVFSLARIATGGRGLEHWTLPDLTLIRDAAAAQLTGQPIAGAPVGLSGYEMIFLISAALSLVSYLLLRRLRPDRSEDAGLEAGEQENMPIRAVLSRAFGIGAGLFKEKTFWAFLLFISVLVLVRAIFVHAHSTWPTYMIREFGQDVPQAALWSINPLLIIFLTPVVGSLTSRFSAWSVIMTGSFITAFSVVFLIIAPAMAGGAGALLQPIFGAGLDTRLAGPLFFVVVLSLGEALWSPRLYEYVAMMAPPGREASYMGLTQLPLFGAKPLVGLMSGMLLSSYCPEHGARQSEIMWTVVFVTTLAGPLIALLFSGIIRAAERLRQAEDALAQQDAGA